MATAVLCCLLFIAVLVCCLVPADCYANGKVSNVCGSMEPQHDVPGETTQSPYRLETNTTTFSPADRIQVTLSGTSHFEGFLLQARDAANQGSVSTVGTFTLTNTHKTQLLTCNNHQGSAVSQTSGFRETEMVFIWNAPTDAPRQVQFFATVVAHYKKFWVKMPGPIIYQHGVTPHPPQSDTTPPIQMTSPSILPGPFTSVGCGQSKSCLLDPPGCDPEDPNCFFLSMTTVEPSKTSVIFELSGPADGYVSFALSWDKWMGNDDAYMCVKDGERVSVSAAFFSGRSHPQDESQRPKPVLGDDLVIYAIVRDIVSLRQTDLPFFPCFCLRSTDRALLTVPKSRMVTKGDGAFAVRAPKIWSALPEDLSLSSVSWRLVDGAIQCRFSRPVKLANQEPARFDLDQEYFLFVANGQAQYGEIRRHHLQPLISTRTINIIGPPEVLSGSRGPIIMKMHGALMLVAWMLTGSVGTFIASFYKPDWPNQVLLGQKVWFQVHRGLMMLTVILTIVAFCLPFFYRKGWSEHAGVHPYLGCCVLALSLIQPIMAVIRPSPDSHRRYIFNWAHWVVGYVTEIMAVAAMFLGTHQSSLLLPQPLATHVLIGYVTWLASFRVLLQMHKHLYIKKLLGLDDTQGILSGQSERGRWESFLKSLVLAVLALGNAGLLMALLSHIAEV